MDAKSSNKTATLTVGNKTYDFPILSGTVGPDVIDIAKLYAQAGMFTYDPGFTSTGSCQSKITYIDGDAGVLEYRGYPIEQLAENGDFLETCYLLLYGELPTAAQKADFDDRVTHHTMVHEQMSRFFQGFRRDAHPMAVMTGCVGALSAFYHDSTDISDPHQRMVASIRMTSTMRRTSCACALPCHARSTSPIRYWRARWTAFSSCTPTTSRTPPRPPCG